MIEAQRLIGQGAPKEFPQIRPVRDIARGPVHELAPLAHRRRREQPAVLPASVFPSEFESNGKVVELTGEIEPSKEADHVRGNDDARPNLVERGRLLVTLSSGACRAWNQ